MFLNKEDFCPLSIFRNRKVLNTATHFFVTRTHLVLGNYGEESDIFKMYSAIADGDNQSSLGNDSCHAGITNHCSGMIFRHSGMAPAARESFLPVGNDHLPLGNHSCHSGMTICRPGMINGQSLVIPGNNLSFPTGFCSHPGVNRCNRTEGMC